MMSVIHTQIINKDITLGSIGKETYVKTIVSNKEKNTKIYFASEYNIPEFESIYRFVCGDTKLHLVFSHKKLISNARTCLVLWWI